MRDSLNFLFIFILLLLFIVGGCFLKRQDDLSKNVDLIDSIINETIANYNIKSSDIREEVYETKKEAGATYPYIKKVYRIKDKNVEFKDVRKELNEKLKKVKASIIRSQISYYKDFRLAFFDIEYRGFKVYTLNFESFLKREDIPKIAIVLDDWGYNLATLEMAWKLGIPITFSILPNLPYSTNIAREAYARNHEVILHLPMESYKSKAVEKYVIKTDMNEDQIIKIFEKSLKSVALSCGVSNHMGSKATEDKRLLKTLFVQMKEKDLYFLDSLVTDKSKAEDVARELGLKFARRSVFLDNENNFDYIKKQVEELVAIAKATGQAIGIGHNRKSTLGALEKIISELEKEEIEFVYVSELVR